MMASETEVQRECVRLYFENLHCIHPILDHADFLARCESEVWAHSGQVIGGLAAQNRKRSRFLALFNAVLAIGAITAGETSTLMLDRTSAYIGRAEGSLRETNHSTAYRPIQAARLFFERAKHHLGDIFDSCALETAQTLFLMSVFCQNALKPHSCYMYSGMAIRTAMAIGIPTRVHSSLSQESYLWWALYSHEVEMCLSTGRRPFLQSPRHYPLPLAQPSGLTYGGPTINLISAMVGLAQILLKMPAHPGRQSNTNALDQQSRSTTELDAHLEEWRAHLPSELDFNTSPLNEGELITKQKVVLKLRKSSTCTSHFY
jgi:hypothetical protein